MESDGRAKEILALLSVEMAAIRPAQPLLETRRTKSSLSADRIGQKIREKIAHLRRRDSQGTWSENFAQTGRVGFRYC